MKPIDYITEVEFKPGNGKTLLARGNFVVAGQVAINFSLFSSANGPRLVLPNTPNPKFDDSQPNSKDNKKFFDEVRPISADARVSLETYILQAYNNHAGPAAIESEPNGLPF